MNDVTVIKQDPNGMELFRYPGRLLRAGDNWMQLEAVFQRANQSVGPLELMKGDRFVELFLSDRWFNIFTVFAGANGALRGWYCNIAYPAEIKPGQVVQRDLALDLVVLPDGTSVRLDQAEYDALELPGPVRQAADAAASQLEAMAASGRAPFHPIHPTAPLDMND